MKVTLLSLALFIALLAAGHAIDIITPTDKYFDVKVTRVEADGVRITHREGTALVDFDDLPPAMQAEHGWTPEKSAARKAVKAAEAKRIADEERMIEDEPKRKAEEAAAKERAIEGKKRTEDLAAAKLDTEAALKDSLADAAKLRAEIDAARKGAKGGGKTEVEAPSVPVAEVMPSAAGKAASAVSRVGSVAAMLEEEKSTDFNRNVAIALGVASFIVVVLFLLASGRNKIRVVTHSAGRRR